MKLRQFFTVAFLAILTTITVHAITLPTPGAGTDGAFTPTENIEINLATAITGPWNTTNSNGNGVYDPEQWAVIFRYTEVTIPSGVTVTFKNNHACAPVIWLVQGDVTIDGQVNLDGASGQWYSVVPTEPGPGGFRGGRGSLANAGASYGFGPGGGRSSEWDTGGLFTSVYANEGCFPLIGGSGAGGFTFDSGGAGGGAILIAVQGSIAINVAKGISASGGNGWNSYGGSGGMIRLVAETVTGNGSLYASGSDWGEPGRIRIETINNEFTGGSSPNYSFGVAQESPRVLRDETTPLLTPRTLGGVEIPADPRSRLRYPADVQINDAGEANLVVDAVNVPPASTVTVRIVREDGSVDTPELTMTSSDGAASTWEGLINVTGGFSAMQVHAKFN